MTRFRWALGFALAALLMLPAAALAQQSSPVVRGNVIYAGQEALPAGATLIVQLQDVSRADVAAVQLAEQTLAVGGRRPPIAYELRYNPVQILPTGRYVVRAEVRVQNVLIYTTPSSVPVLSGGAPTTADITLQRTTNALPATSGGAALPLLALALLAGAGALYGLRRRIRPSS